MKTYLFTLSFLLLLASCGNTQKNKVEATDSQSIASGSGEVLSVDTLNSVISWKGSKPGGEHVGTIKLTNGEITINDNKLVSASFVVNMKSIVDTDIEDKSMNDMLVNHLKSPDFFDVEKYPTSNFAVTKVEALAEANDSITHMISGNLKMKDVEKNITFGAKITKEGDNTYKAVSIPFTIDRTQWNVKYGSKTIFADLKDKIINDGIELQIILLAKQKK